MNTDELDATIGLVKMALQKVHSLSVTLPGGAELQEPMINVEVATLLLTQSLVRLEVLKDQISVNQ